MKNHFIRQFVLREFADERKRLYVYDKEKCEVRHTSTRNAFSINNFYDDDVEQSLSRLEAELSSRIYAMLSSRRNSDQVPQDLSIPEVVETSRFFMLLQLVRTPYIKGIGAKTLDKRLSDQELDGILKKYGFENTRKNRREARETEARWYRDVQQARGSKLFQATLVNALIRPETVMPDLADAISNKGVILARTESAFILGDRGALSTATSDKPLSDQDREIFFPLAPDVALVLGGEKDQLQFWNVSRKVARQVNLSVFKSSDRYVASHSRRLLRSLRNPR